MKEFEFEDLAQYDGKDGKPAYIVHQGRVFDVSQSKLWKGGIHMRRHHAGTDLTVDFGGAPHGTEVFERYPQAGIIKKPEAPEREIPEMLSRLLQRFPMLRRHPHPMTVHFPIVFMLSATVFNILSLITGVESFETTALHCLGAGVLFTPIVMATGLYTWWLNYMARPMRTVKTKIVVSIGLLVVSLTAFAWRVAVPDVLHSFTPLSTMYFVLILALMPLVVIIGWLGANLTFPIERD